MCRKIGSEKKYVQKNRFRKKVCTEKIGSEKGMHRKETIR